MKRFLLTLAVLALSIGSAFASETSDKFAQWLPNLAATDIKQRQEAQQSWQALCQGSGKNAVLQKEINKLMTDQLAKENPLETTVWLLRQLGLTGDASVVPTVAKYLKSDEIRIKDEAARALANIPDKAAVQALRSVQSEQAKNALISRNYKTATVKVGVETAFPQALPYAGDREVAQWMRGYSKLSDTAKAATLNALAIRAENTKTKTRAVVRSRRPILENRTNRAEKQYVKYALESVESSDAGLRDAALLSLSSLGGVDEVPFLVGQVFAGQNKELASLVLSQMVGDEIDAALMRTLESEQDQGKFFALADILNRRYNKNIRPVLLTRAKAAETESSSRLQLLQLAEPLSNKENVGDFVEVWALISDKGQKGTAEQVIARLAGGDATPVLAKLTSPNSDDSLSLLGRISDPKTLDNIGKQPNALRALSNWSNAKVADNLFKIAEDEKTSEADKITALRAFTRVISLPNDQLGISISVPEQTARLEKAFALAKRDEDKQLIISRAGQVRAVESLRFVLKSFDEPALQEAVNGAILDLAHHVDLKRTAKDEFNQALDKVLATTKQNEFKDRAKRYKDQN